MSITQAYWVGAISGFMGGAMFMGGVAILLVMR
jgi:hypothetical protein